MAKGAATGEHGQAHFDLAIFLAPFHRRPGVQWPGGWLFGNNIDVYFDAASTLRPDVAGWRRDHVLEAPRGIPITVRPDWVCEILSTNRRNDLVKKKRVYHRSGVPHSWILDPAEATLTVHRWTPDGYLEVLSAERHETVRAEPFDAIALQVGVLFGDDEDESPPA